MPLLRSPRIREFKSDPIERAFRAYFRTNPDALQPANYSGIEVSGETEYVVLRNINGVLAVYRITATGGLRRGRNWLFNASTSIGGAPPLLRKPVPSTNS